MAKRRTRKPTRRRTPARATTRTTARRTTATKNLPRFNQGVPQEIIAIIMAALTVLLVFAVFNFGGSLVTSLFHGLRLAFGFAAYVLPVITGLLAYMLFRPEAYDTTATNYIGLGGFVISLSTLLHVPISADQADASARAGNGGGYLGYGLSHALLNVLDPLAAGVILVALLAIFLILAANIRLTELFAPLKGLKKSHEANEELQINEGGVATSTALPIRGTLGGSKAKAEKEEEVALVAVNDPNWVLPSLDLLKGGTTKPDAGNIKQNATTIQTTLSSFGIEVNDGRGECRPDGYAVHPQAFRRGEAEQDHRTVAQPGVGALGAVDPRRGADPGQGRRGHRGAQ